MSGPLPSTAFVERTIEFFGSHEITARRLMTDNAFSYVRNRSLRELLASKEVKHITTQPYRPQTNGKVERLHQTLAREGVGLWNGLPLPPPSKSGPATLARAGPTAH